MGVYPAPAVERAMKVQEVILRAVSGELAWVQAAEILGLSARSIRRWRARYEEQGYDGLYDRRTGRPSPQRVPLATVEHVLQLYRERYADFNVRHFHEVLHGEHGIDLSYSWVKKALQTAGLVPVGRKRGPHRRRRERRPLPGMLLHIDASTHRWLTAGPAGRMQDLVSVSDDATGEVYYGAFVEEENTRTILAALRAVVETQGVFCALYSDRASHFIHTPSAGQEPHPTQVQRVLAHLGIRLIAAHSPQARGRKERFYRTVQGRWPQELRVRGITTMAAANAWLQAEGIAAFNHRFGVPAAQAGTAFVPPPAGLERLFTIQHARTVSNANTVQFQRRVLQIGATPLRCYFVRCRVTVHEHLDGTLSITYGPHTIARFTATGDPVAQAAAA